MSQGLATLVFERTLNHPPEAVWAALTDPRELRQWFLASSVKIDGRAGGSIEMVAGPPQVRSTGRILTWDPPRVLEYEWKVAPRPEHPNGEDSVVRWQLTAVGSSTRLELTHRRLSEAVAMGFVAGLHAFLDRLEAQLAGAPLPDWMQRFGELHPGYAASASGC
jgi:uncharacterized protein YndB with AHSA1/START domain